jgi:hypothetical protein
MGLEPKAWGKLAENRRSRVAQPIFEDQSGGKMGDAIPSKSITDPRS